MIIISNLFLFVVVWELNRAAGKAGRLEREEELMSKMILGLSALLLASAASGCENGGKKAVPEPNAAANATVSAAAVSGSSGQTSSSSGSLAVSYSSLRELTDASVLVAEVRIEGPYRPDDKYPRGVLSASVLDVLKGEQSSRTIGIVQSGADLEEEPGVSVSDSGPYLHEGDEAIVQDAEAALGQPE